MILVYSITENLALTNDIQTIFGFDFGLRRIGVAVGNTQIRIAHPLALISGRTKNAKFIQIKQLVNKWQPQLFVVGMPSDGEDKQELLASIKRFANRLTYEFRLPVTYVNEDYSSAIAVDWLNEQDVRGYSQKVALDEVAACVILNSYFNSNKLG